MKMITGDPDCSDFAAQAPDDLTRAPALIGVPTPQFQEEYAKIEEMLKENKRARDFWSKFRGVVDERPDPRYIKNGFGGAICTPTQANAALEKLRQHVQDVCRVGWREPGEDNAMDQRE